MKKRPYLLLILALLVLSITLTFALPKIWEITKENLAEKQIEKATKFYALESYKQAYLKAKEAKSLIGNRDDICILLAHAGSMTKENETILWWSKIIHTGKWQSEPLEEWTQHCIDIKQFDLSDFYVSKLLIKDPDNAKAQNWKLDSLKRNRKYKELISYTEELIESGANNADIIEYYSFAILATQGKEALIQKLKNYAHSESSIQFAAIEYLLSRNIADTADSHTYADLLLKNSKNDYENLLLALSTKADLEPQNQALYSSQLIEQTDKQSDEQLAKCILWHNYRDLAALSLKILTPDQALNSRELYIAYIDTLLLNDNGQEAYDLTLRPLDTLPINKTENLILRARALNHLGNEEELNEVLKTAAETAEYQDFSTLEKTLSSSGKWDILIMMYNRLIENPRTRSYGNTKLAIASYFIGDTFEVRKHLRQLDNSEKEKDPMIQNTICYLNLLLNNDRVQNYKTAEGLATEYNNIYDFRIPLAFSYFLQERSDIALELITPTKQFTASQPRYYKIVCAAILQRNNKTDEALDMIDGLRFDKLIGPEKLLIKDLILEKKKRNADS